MHWYWFCSFNEGDKIEWFTSEHLLHCLSLVECFISREGGFVNIKDLSTEPPRQCACTLFNNILSYASLIERCDILQQGSHNFVWVLIFIIGILYVVLCEKKENSFHSYHAALHNQKTVTHLTSKQLLKLACYRIWSGTKISKFI